MVKCILICRNQYKEAILPKLRGVLPWQQKYFRNYKKSNRKRRLSIKRSAAQNYPICKCADAVKSLILSMTKSGLLMARFSRMIHLQKSDAMVENQRISLKLYEKIVPHYQKDSLFLKWRNMRSIREELNTVLSFSVRRARFTSQRKDLCKGFKWGNFIILDNRLYPKVKLKIN